MKVLALFDGISCGQVALKRAGIKVDKYYSSEIDKISMQITHKNFPDTVMLGDLTKWQDWDIPWEEIGLVTAGFPCQAWSVGGKQKGDNDPRGQLVHDLISIWNKAKAKNPNVLFMFENVKMKKANLEYINRLFGEEPILINSSLVSAQNRSRYYWTNIPNVEQPEDKELVLKDVLEQEPVDEVYYVKGLLSSNYKGGARLNPSYRSQANTVHDIKKKSMTLCAGSHGYALGYVFNISSSGRGNGIVVAREYGSENKKAHCLTKTGYTKRAFTGVCTEGRIRRLTPLECERLQTLPEGYTEGVSNTQRYKTIGNGWTVDVIAHILKNIPKDLNENAK